MAIRGRSRNIKPVRQMMGKASEPASDRSYLGHKAKYQASAEEIRRKNLTELHKIKEQQRRKNILATGQLLKLGGSLYDAYHGNKELIEYAKSRGFETSTSSFTNWFLEPRFKAGKGLLEKGVEDIDYDRSFIMGLKSLGEYRSTKNTLNLFDMMEENMIPGKSLFSIPEEEKFTSGLKGAF